MGFEIEKVLCLDLDYNAYIDSDLDDSDRKDCIIQQLDRTVKNSMFYLIIRSFKDNNFDVLNDNIKLIYNVYNYLYCDEHPLYFMIWNSVYDENNDNKYVSYFVKVSQGYLFYYLAEILFDLDMSKTYDVDDNSYFTDIEYYDKDTESKAYIFRTLEEYNNKLKECNEDKNCVKFFEYDFSKESE